MKRQWITQLKMSLTNVYLHWGYIKDQWVDEKMFDNISYQGNANFILLFYIMSREGCSVGKLRGPGFRFTAHTQKLGMVEESCDPTTRSALWEARTASQ